MNDYDTTTYTGPVRLVRVDPRDRASVSEADARRLERFGYVVIYASFPVVIEDDPNV